MPLSHRSQSRRGLVKVVCLASLALLPAVAHAAEGTPVPPGIDRIIFALGVLLTLSLAIERVFAALVKVLGPLWERIKTWLPNCTLVRREADEPENGFAVHGWRVLVTIPLACYSGIDFIDLLNTGVLKYYPWGYEAAPPAAAAAIAATPNAVPHWVGLVLTGLIASMGSAFLTQLIELLKAIRDTKQKDLAAKRPDPGGHT